MKVQVEAGLFDCGAIDVYRALRRLFEFAAVEKHEISIIDPEALLNSDFFRVACAEMDRVEWEELITRVASVERFASSGNEGSRRYALVSASPPAQSSALIFVPIDSLLSWVERPLRVLLENQSDAILVRLATAIAAADTLSRALEEGWLSPDGRGGSGEVLNTILKAGSEERLFVIVDSDREEPSGEESKTARIIRKEATARGIEVHVLERRELESYVPDALWEHVTGSYRRPRSKGRAANRRVVQVYRWLLGQVQANLPRLKGKHSENAVEHVVKKLQSEAEKEVSERSLRDALDEWRRMPSAERYVDDLKVRFGERVAEQAVEKMSSEKFVHGWLDDDARDELGRIASKIEAWL